MDAWEICNPTRRNIHECEECSFCRYDDEGELFCAYWDNEKEE